MKTILCYGDSNTYGYNPNNGGRYDINLIWPSLLNELLKDEYIVYNEGLNGRTTAYDREGSSEKNGLAKLKETLDKYNNIDIIIFMLGTNDCNVDLYESIDDIASGMEKLIQKAKEHNIPNIIVVTPAAILPYYAEGTFAYQLDDTSVYKSNNLDPLYKNLCEKYSCIHLDCTNKLEVTKLDSEHLTLNGHKKLAELLYEIINKL